MPHNLNRRQLIKGGMAAGTTAMLASASAAAATAPAAAAKPATDSSPGNGAGNALPRWRGFNLMPFFSALSSAEQYRDNMIDDRELAWIRDWGFDYVRLPVDYWFFVDGDWPQTKQMRPDAVTRVSEAGLERLDTVVTQCQAHGLHLTINLHRAPGYCINGWEREPFNLFRDAAAEEAFAFWWDLLARRYAGVSDTALSFNLVNEAPGVSDKMSRGDYRRVMLRGLDAIHAVSPGRTVIIDGTGVGREVVMNMTDEPVAQAFHAYDPFRLTHYKASWVGDNADWPVPAWPAPEADGSFTGPKQMGIALGQWAELARQGGGVHCGEFGCFNHTPHDVFLAWMEAVLEWLAAHEIGYALWNFSGAFGVLDSGRADVDYEDWHGHRLDRALLDLLRKY